MATNPSMWTGINYNEVFPRSFYEVHSHAKSVISTHLGKQPKRWLADPFPAQIAHSDYHGDVVNMAYTIRSQFPGLLPSIKTPQSWEELYEYFDAVDLWMQGPRFLMCVLDYLERFCYTFEIQDADTEFNQVRQVVASWGAFNKNTILSSSCDQELIALFTQQYEPARVYSPRQSHFVGVCITELRQQAFENSNKEFIASPAYAQSFQGAWQPQTSISSQLPQTHKPYQQTGPPQQQYVAYNNGVSGGGGFYQGGRMGSPMNTSQNFYHAPTYRADPMQHTHNQQHRFVDRRTLYQPDYTGSNSPRRSKIPNSRVVSAPVSSPQRQQDRLGGGATVVYARRDSITNQGRRNQDYQLQSPAAPGRMSLKLSPTSFSKARPTAKGHTSPMTSIVENRMEGGKSPSYDRKDSAVDMSPQQATKAATKSKVHNDVGNEDASVLGKQNEQGDCTVHDDHLSSPSKPDRAEKTRVEEAPAISKQGDVRGDSTKDSHSISSMTHNQQETVTEIEEAFGNSPKSCLRGGSTKSNLSISSTTLSNIGSDKSQAESQPETRFSYSQDSLPSPQTEVLYDVVDHSLTNSTKSSRVDIPNDARLMNPKVGAKGRTITCVHEEHRPNSMTFYYVDSKLVERDTEGARTAKITGYNEHAVKSHLIMDMFSQCGPIEFITYHPGRNLGFIQFTNSKSVDEAIKTYNNWTMPNTTVIKVSYSHQSRRRSRGRGTSRSSNSSVHSISPHSHAQSKDYSISTKKENLPTDQPEHTEPNEPKEEESPAAAENPKEVSKKKGKSGKNQKKTIMPTPSHLADSDFPPLAPSKPSSTIVDGRPPRITTVPNKPERAIEKDWPFVKKCVSK